jgi:hypothetical protein
MLWILNSILATISVYCALITGFGLGQTCNQFTSLEKVSCSSVFEKGFTLSKEAPESKSLSGAYAVQGAFWTMFVCYMLLACYEYARYRTFALKWFGGERQSFMS